LGSLLAMPMTFESWFAARHPQIPIAGATAVLRLAEGGATVPFIARYRKEQTGALDEVAIRAVIDGKESWDDIVKQQAYVVGEIERQGKLTPELRDKILGTFDMTALEDLYLPYKQKRKTKAVIAREAGLQPWLTGCGIAATGSSRPRRARRPTATPAHSAIQKRACLTWTRP